MKSFLITAPLFHNYATSQRFSCTDQLTKLKKLRRICRMTPGKVALRSSCTPEGQLRYIESFSMSFIHCIVGQKETTFTFKLKENTRTATVQI